MRKLKAVLIGAGNRGITYSQIMSDSPEKFEIVAVAEPIWSRRKAVKDLFNIPEELCFEDYESLYNLGKIADFAIIATMDRDHYEPTIAAIKLKYDILLEKPIAPTKEECLEIERMANENNVRIVICTVLRYSDVFRNLKSIIDSGKLGRIMSVNHEECVGNIHQSHSFVRGNWGNSQKSSTMLLQKSCHDLDILQWLIGKKCINVQSFGSLSYFTKENAPQDTPEHCIDGCRLADKCRFNAVKLYLDDKHNKWFRTTCTRLENPTDDDVKRAITETQYGKCVFKCDNDVVDHQTVNMLFEDDITVTFTMNAFNRGGRFIHIMGTKAELRAALDKDTPIEIYDFETDKKTEIPLCGADGIASGHGGGDAGMINDLYSYFCGDYTGVSIPTIKESLYSHMLVFAAEESRLRGNLINVKDFIENNKV